MTNKEQRIVFANNLKRLIAEAGKTQQEVADDLDIQRTTLNNWCTAISLPRWNAIQDLAAYFHTEAFVLINHYDPRVEAKQKIMAMCEDMNEGDLLRVLSYAKFLKGGGDNVEI